MDWDEDTSGHASDHDNQRQPEPSFAGDFPAQNFASQSPSFSAPAWEAFTGDAAVDGLSKRLDYLLPIDAETGVTTHEAVCVYMDAMIEMVSRHGQPLALLSIAVDASPVLRFLGMEGAALIGRAVARCLRQETRTHDVVGHADPDMAPDAFTFLVTCPLLSEEQAANLGERLRAAMTASSGDAPMPWLTLSVGVAALSLEITESRLLVARSMESLRRARRAGGGCVWKHTDTRRKLMEDTDREEGDATGRAERPNDRDMLEDGQNYDDQNRHGDRDQDGEV